MGANNGKQCGSEGKGSSSISSDLSSGTDLTPTKAPRTVTASEDSDLSMRTLSTPSPALILSLNPHLSPKTDPSGHDSPSSSRSPSPTIPRETIAIVHAPPGTQSCKQSSKTHSIALINFLPDPILLQILAHLSTPQLCRCARVCRRWYSLTWDPRLWRTIRLRGEMLNVDRALKILTQRLCQDTPNVCLTLETVVASGCPRLSDRSLHVLAQCCPELRCLEVAGCHNVSNKAVFDIVTHCPNLEHLDVSGCPKVTCIRLTKETSVPVHGQQIGLRYLDMTDCTSLEDEGLRTIALHCPRLTHLYLRRCTRLTDESLHQLALYCPILRQLSLSDCHLLGDFGLREVARMDGQLRHLSVAHCSRITDVGLRYVARYCPRLRYLNARGCEGITDQGLGHLAHGCPKLRALDVGRCPLVSDVGVEVLAHCCTGLRRLSLRGCECVTGRGLRVLAKVCPELQMLNVQECEVPAEVLRLVRRHCKRCVIEHTIPAFY